MRKRRISTHTLTWSVTDEVADQCVEKLNFNSHAHVERDPLQVMYHKLLNHFNSHAHVERDPSTSQELSDSVISTHTLTWSVTQYP